MEKNYFGAIEFGSLFNNILIMSYSNNKLDVVASLSAPSEGYLNGEIIDENLFNESIAKLLLEVTSKFKIDVDELILILPNNAHNIASVSLSCNVLTEKQIIGKLQVESIKKQILNNSLSEDQITINQVPTLYILDNGRSLRTEPINYQSSKLQINSNVHSLPKRIVLPLQNALRNNNIKILDSIINCHCGAIAVSNNYELEGQCIHINIGQDSTTLTAYYKNIIIAKSIQLNFGLSSLVRYLANTLNIKKDFALELINSFFLCNIDYASDVIFDENLKLSEKRVSGIVLNRLYNAFAEITESFKSLVEEVKFSADCKVLLTGCLNDYEFFVEEFSKNSQIDVIEGNINCIGIANQSFVNCFGAIKNFINENKELLISRLEEKITVNDYVAMSNEKSNEPDANEKGKFRDIFDD